jgi:hypothetical protein
VVYDPEKSTFRFRPEEDRSLGNQQAFQLHQIKDKHPPPFYYIHESNKDIKFWYPLPIPRDDDYVATQYSSNDGLGRYLCGSTHSAVLELRAAKVYFGGCTHEILTNESQESVGRLWVDEPQYASTSMRVELVAISFKYKADGGERWKEPLGQEEPQLYNLLWVTWKDGVAYRRGIGEIDRKAWESQALTPIELILG